MKGRRTPRYTPSDLLPSQTLFVLCIIFLWTACFAQGTSVLTASMATKYEVDVLEGISPTPETLLKEDIERVVEMTDSTGQKFLCAIPREKPKNMSTVQKRPYPAISEILSPLASNCIYRIEGWWTYEVCYGKQVTQFHQEGDQKTALFVLGKKTKHTRQKQLEQEKKEAEEAEEAERLGIPDDVPPGAKEYYIEDYEEGTKCDLSGEPRSVELHFYCSLSNRVGVITSIKEPRSCHYAVTVETSMLCSHPHYMKTEEKALPIVCVEGDQELLQQLRETAAAEATTERAPDDETREDSVGGEVKEDLEGEEGGAETVVVIEASDPSEDDEFSSTL